MLAKYLLCFYHFAKYHDMIVLECVRSGSYFPISLKTDISVFRTRVFHASKISPLLLSFRKIPWYDCSRMRELLFLIWVRWLRWISAAENWFENQCLKKGTLLFGKWLFCHYLWQSQYKEKSYKRCCLFFDQFISLAIFSINRYLWSDGFFELPILSSFQIYILLWVCDVYFFSYRGKRDYQSKKKNYPKMARDIGK